MPKLPRPATVRWYTASLLFGLGVAAVVRTAAASPAKSDKQVIDLKPTPARVTTSRHTGPFAAGSALSLGAELKPLDPAPVKEVRLDTVHRVIDLAPGVKFSAWTFGGQVPGPPSARAWATRSASA